MDLIKMATAFRALQMYTHQAHNLTSGVSFFSDHEYFGELYGFAEECYDSLIERSIGKGKKPSLKKVILDVSSILSIIPEDDFLQNSLMLIDELIGACEEVAKREDLGTNNLIAGIADKLQVHKYKIQQRSQR